MKLILVFAGLCLALASVSALTNKELYEMLSKSSENSLTEDVEVVEEESPIEDNEDSYEVIELPGDEDDEVDVDALMTRLQGIDCGLGCHHRRWWWWRRRHRHYRVCGHCVCRYRWCNCRFGYRVLFYRRRWITIRIRVHTQLWGHHRVRVLIYFNRRLIYHRICAMSEDNCVELPGLNTKTCFKLQQASDNEVCSSITGQYTYQGQQMEVPLRDACLPMDSPKTELPEDTEE